MPEPMTYPRITYSRSMEGRAVAYVASDDAHEMREKLDCDAVRAALVAAVAALSECDGRTATYRAAEAFARLAHFHT